MQLAGANTVQHTKPTCHDSVKHTDFQATINYTLPPICFTSVFTYKTTASVPSPNRENESQQLFERGF